MAKRSPERMLIDAVERLSYAKEKGEGFVFITISDAEEECDAFMQLSNAKNALISSWAELRFRGTGFHETKNQAQKIAEEKYKKEIEG